MQLSFLTDTLFVHALVGVFVIVNPFGNVPLFISLTQKLTPAERKNAIIKSVIIATAILLVFALIGKMLFDMLNVTLDSLRIAGGLLLLAIAFDMLMGRSPASKIDEDEERESVAVTPMATPLLAGPGAMTTVMILMNEASTPVLKGSIMLAILLAMIAAFIILINCEWVYNVIRKDGARVLTKIMGIVLATIAVEMAVKGLLHAFPALGV
ncbi:MarC family protein [Methanocella conradii]|uniref:MarC family protein n=1 Tax=Methanocella conradii TaxID=1175444 RepID=UPI0024B3A2FD|nr:MarC family protein [Methanocella conradii]MDI6897440.1 MarC family protein [Methanocella conradii]